MYASALYAAVCLWLSLNPGVTASFRLAALVACMCSMVWTVPFILLHWVSPGGFGSANAADRGLRDMQKHGLNGVQKAALVVYLAFNVLVMYWAVLRSTWVCVPFALVGLLAFMGALQSLHPFGGSAIVSSIAFFLPLGFYLTAISAVCLLPCSTVRLAPNHC